jgi:hypothetical protein
VRSNPATRKSPLRGGWGKKKKHQKQNLKKLFNRFWGSSNNFLGEKLINPPTRFSTS